jgi:hypothetical protein
MRIHTLRSLVVGVGMVWVRGALAQAPADVPPPQPAPEGQQQTNVYVQSPPPAPPPEYVQPAPPPAPVVVAPAQVPMLSRFSLIYSPEVSLGSSGNLSIINGGNGANGNGSHGTGLTVAAQNSTGVGIHNIGLETSTPTGFFARYHATLDYSYGYGYSGVRIEPLGFGWAFPIVRTDSVSFEVEPLVSLVDGTLLFSNDQNNNANVTFLASSGAEVQANLTVGPIYFFASPVGMQLRWLEATTGDGGGTGTGADWLWRFRAGVGFQY